MTYAISPGSQTLPRRAGLFALILAFSSAAAGVAPAQDRDPLVAKVNGVEIHESDLTIAEEEAGQLPPMTPEARKDYLVQFMADMILVSKAAEDKKFADSKSFKKHLDIARKKLLMAELLQSVGREALTDAAMHKVYDDAVKQMGEEREVRARHILIRAAPGDEKGSKEAEEKIKAIIARLRKGENFETLAKETTEDPSGKANGGDLGYFTKEQMVPEFAEAAFKLKPGEISGPVKTQFGWHVIKLEDSRIKAPPTFDEVKGQIENFVTRRAQAELVQKLRSEAKIEKFYKTEPETPPAAPDKQ